MRILRTMCKVAQRIRKKFHLMILDHVHNAVLRHTTWPLLIPLHLALGRG